MENVTCRDILRHGSPFRQGVCQSFTAFVGLLNTAMKPPDVQPEVSSLHLSHCRPFLHLSAVIHCQDADSLFVLSASWVSSCLSTSIPVPAVWSRPLPSPFLHSRGWCPGPSAWASRHRRHRCRDPRPHCVFPEACARTRCRLIASSRNPATFSLSSYTEHRFKTMCETSTTTVQGLIFFKMWKGSNRVFFYLINEGVVNKLTGKVFGGVSWKFHIKYISSETLCHAFPIVKQTRKWTDPNQQAGMVCVFKAQYTATYSFLSRLLSKNQKQIVYTHPVWLQ